MQLLFMILWGAAAVLFPFFLGWLGVCLRDRKSLALPCAVMALDLALGVYALCTLQIHWWG